MTTRLWSVWHLMAKRSDGDSVKGHLLELYVSFGGYKLAFGSIVGGWRYSTVLSILCTLLLLPPLLSISIDYDIAIRVREIDAYLLQKRGFIRNYRFPVIPIRINLHFLVEDFQCWSLVYFQAAVICGKCNNPITQSVSMTNIHSFLSIDNVKPLKIDTDNEDTDSQLSSFVIEKFTLQSQWAFE